MLCKIAPQSVLCTAPEVLLPFSFCHGTSYKCDEPAVPRTEPHTRFARDAQCATGSYRQASERGKALQ